MRNNIAGYGFIGVPDEETIDQLEKKLGKPVKIIKKKEKVILLIGSGLFKKKLIIPSLE